MRIDALSENATVENAFSLTTKSYLCVGPSLYQEYLWAISLGGIETILTHHTNWKLGFCGLQNTVCYPTCKILFILNLTRSQFDYWKSIPTNTISIYNKNPMMSNNIWKMDKTSYEHKTWFVRVPIKNLFFNLDSSIHIQCYKRQ